MLIVYTARQSGKKKMQAAKRRRLTIDTIRHPPDTSQSIDQTIIRRVPPGFADGNTSFQIDETQGLFATATVRGVPVECSPVVPGLCVTTVKMHAGSTRPNSGEVIITVAEDNERSGVADPRGGADAERYYRMYRKGARTSSNATFQYHGVVHTRQSNALPYKISNVDHILTRFAGSIAQPTAKMLRFGKPFKTSVPPLFDHARIFHKIDVMRKGKPVMVGTRRIYFKRVAINQGRHRKWLLSPGSVLQTQSVFIYSNLQDRRLMRYIREQQDKVFSSSPTQKNLKNLTFNDIKITLEYIQEEYYEDPNKYTQLEPFMPIINRALLKDVFDSGDKILSQNTETILSTLRKTALNTELAKALSATEIPKVTISCGKLFPHQIIEFISFPYQIKLQWFACDNCNLFFRDTQNKTTTFAHILNSTDMATDEFTEYMFDPTKGTTFQNIFDALKAINKNMKPPPESLKGAFTQCGSFDGNNTQINESDAIYWMRRLSIAYNDIQLVKNGPLAVSGSYDNLKQLCTPLGKWHSKVSKDGRTTTYTSLTTSPVVITQHAAFGNRHAIAFSPES